jgi:hypothetical protein
MLGRESTAIVDDQLIWMVEGVGYGHGDCPRDGITHNPSPENFHISIPLGVG